MEQAPVHESAIVVNTASNQSFKRIHEIQSDSDMKKRLYFEVIVSWKSLNDIFNLLAIRILGRI